VQLKQIGEFRLIDIISKQTSKSPPSVIKGIGDDAAVVKADTKQYLLITTDILKEGVHFKKDYTSPYLLGKKCISVNLSDIAAMGGSPLYYFVSLSAPSDASLEFIKKLYRGMDRQAKRFSTFLLGGDTISSQGRISISITLLGKAAKDSVIYRHGAKKGDNIYVTGCLGDSVLGLLMLKNNQKLSSKNPLIRKHLDPTPRIEEGKQIALRKIASSMIDISDGLISDLRHILTQSRVGAKIRLSCLPLSPQYKKHCPEFSKDFYHPALCGGEDYELLFTAHPKNRAKLEKLSKQLKTPVTCIGEITGNPSELVILDKNSREITLKEEGYSHFRF